MKANEARWKRMAETKQIERNRAGTHPPKWILLREDWMLQYWQNLPDLWGTGITAASVSKTKTLPTNGLTRCATRALLEDKNSQIGQDSSRPEGITSGRTHGPCLIWVLRHTVGFVIRSSCWNGWFSTIWSLAPEIRNKVGWILRRFETYLCSIIVNGRNVGTWKHLQESSADARKDAIDGVNSWRTTGGEIAKCVRAP